MARPDPRDLVPRGPWPSGANNVAREDSVPPKSVREAVNVDFYPGGKIRRRPGSTRTLAQAMSQSLWSDGHYALMVANGVLYRFIPGQPLMPLRSGLQLGADVVYCSLNQYIYVSDGFTALRVNTIDNSVVPWGVATPTRQPTLVATANGGMDAGTYQLAVTFARADGEESGALQSATVDVPDGGGIALSNFPTPPPDVASIQIYLTKPGGTELCWYSAVPANAATAQLYRGDYGRPLQSQLLVPLPPGTDAEQTLGRMFVAVGPLVCWSEPLRYGLFNPANGYAAYASDVLLIAAPSPGALSQGLFVATQSSTYFLTGTDPTQFTSPIVYKAGAVPGSKTLVSGSYFEADGVPDVPVPVWVSTIGTVCIGMPDGTVKPLTEGRFAMAIGDRGAAVVRELNGIRQLLFSMRPPTMVSPLAAQDSVTITRVKNGIVVQ